ncbi:MAG: sugar phosphate isomerase/epimerase [Planctomycetes bacterium]|nr:sugar phosphate isomerase/epimerase [Planctomycetota bacterium]
MTRRACRLIERAPDLGTRCVTLCTGTRDPENMWQAHPGNDSPGAWREMVASLEKLISVAEQHDVTLGIEPEKANVINSAAKARRLLDQMQSKKLKIVIDGANLFAPDDLKNMPEVLAEAFDLLGTDIVLAHAKDIAADPSKHSQAAGTGCLDWDTYFECLQKIGYGGPIVLHNLAPSQVDQSVRFVKNHVAQFT